MGAENDNGMHVMNLVGCYGYETLWLIKTSGSVVRKAIYRSSTL